MKTYLDLSTSHLTQETTEKLTLLGNPAWSEPTWPAMTIAPYQNGVFLSVPHPSAYTLDQFNALPKDLQDVFAYAELHPANIEVIRFDSDGVSVTGLPTYEW